MKRTLLFLLLLILGISICSSVYAQIDVSVGNGTTYNGSIDPPTPYGTFWKNFRQQYLVLASEIQASEGAPGNIYSVAFNVQSLHDCSPMQSFTIRLKQTSQSSLNGGFEFGTYQTVFELPSFMPVLGWNTHTFTAPFVWDGSSNILVDVMTSRVPSSSQNASVFYNTTTFNSSLRYQSDDTEASTATIGATSSKRANIRFNMQGQVVTVPPNPAINVSPTNFASNVATSATLNWRSGGGAPTGYKVHFGTTNPPPFIQNTPGTSYTPTLALNNTYYWKIVPFNAFGDASNSPVWSFSTGGPIVNMSNGQQSVADGMTYSFYDSGGPTGQYQNMENLTFTFTASNPSSIIKVLFTEFSTENNYDILKIYNGPNASYPMIGSTLGYSGVNMPGLILGSNAITFVFTSDQTVPFDGWAAAVSAINLAHDLGAQTITGNLLPVFAMPSNYSVAVKNNGPNSESNYTVKLMGAGDVELASIPGTSIASQQVLNFDLPWTPTAPGPYVLYGKVVLATDQVPQNNQTAGLNINVQVSGAVTVTVGTGGSMERMPMDFYFENSLFEAIYLASELNATGLLMDIQFYNNFVSTNALNKPTKIWMGETTQTDLSGGWIPSTQLALVFDGTVNYPGGQNEILIHLSNPYAYNGGNLVMMVQRPWDTLYYSSSDKFVSETGAHANRTLNVYDQYVALNPAAPPAGTASSATFPMTTFMFGTLGLGSVNGTVSSGGSPLSGATVSIAGSTQSATTNAAGNYSFPFVTQGAYAISATKHGYNTITNNVNVVENQAVTSNFALALLPQVTITGRIVRNDQPTVGIPGASISLSGFEPYSASTNASGNFTIPNVYSGMTYQYLAAAAGYQNLTGQVVVATTNLNMGDVVLNEIAYPPFGVVATENAAMTQVDVSWQAPNPSAISITEGFEGTSFPPATWAQVITNDGPPQASGILPTWSQFGAVAMPPEPPVAPHGGNQQVGLWWDYSHQDEWLITPAFTCPASASVNFWSYVYFGSPNGDHYYVKVSTDNGNTWTVLWDASNLSGGWNIYNSPINVSLAAYANQQIKVAWHADDSNFDQGLWYAWFIDDVSIGSRSQTISFQPGEFTTRSAAGATAKHIVKPGLPSSRALVDNPRLQESVLTLASASDPERAIIGYKVYRLLAANLGNESLWTTLTPGNVNPLNYTDAAWGPLPSGVYQYAVKAVYTNNAMSTAAFSSAIQKGMIGILSGTVTESGTNLPVAGATITAGEYNGSSNAQGVYSFSVYAGTYEVECSKIGYQTASQTAVTIVGLQTTTQNFVLTQLILPPGGVEAVGVNSDLVNINWGEPGTGGDEWLSYADGDAVNAIGTGGAVDFDCAIRFPASVLADYAGASLYAVKAWPMQGGEYFLRVWTGGTASAPGTMVLEQPFSPNPLGEYNTIMLSTPVPITGTEELWFGYRCNVSGGYPAGADAGPATDGFGNMMYYQGAWTTLLGVSAELNYNWNIQGYVGYSAPASSDFSRNGILLHNKSAYPGQHENTDRALTGYKVWRLRQGQETNESAWTSLTPNPITATGLQDTGWGAVEPYVSFKWSVKAIYSGGTESLPAFSNPLIKITQVGTISGLVRNAQNQGIAGATVTCGDISATVNATGAYSITVGAGTVSVTAVANGYGAVTQTGIVVVTGGTTTVNFTLPVSEVLLSDGFETYPNFAVTFAPWTLVDVDLATTYGLTGVAWENAYAAMAYMVFNPSATVPAITNFPAQEGSKFAAAFASTGGVTNNDWLITPQVAGGGDIRFYARSYTAEYGLERFKVGVSTTGTAPANFTIISGTNYIEAPADWTEYTYNLAAYAGQQIYVGIQCISNDAFVFGVDNVRINGSAGDDPTAPAVSTGLYANYPNPFNPETTIRYSVKDASPITIGIYNLKGQLVKTLVSESKAAGNFSIVWNGTDNNGSAVSSGVYYYKMTAGKFSSSRKMILMK